MSTQILQGVLNAMSAIGPILLVTVALSALVAATRVLNASVGATIVVSGFVAVWAEERIGFPGILLGAVGTAVAITVALELFVLRPQRYRQAHVELGSFAATLGVATILIAVGTMRTSGATVSLPPDDYRVEGIVSVGGAAVPLFSLVQFACAVLLAIAFFGVLFVTRFGRQFRAVADNRTLAHAIGISVNRIALLSAVTAGLLTGAAAVLALIHIRSFDVTSAGDYLLVPFAAVVAGGLGSFSGAVIAACFFGVAQTVAVTTIGTAGIQDIIVFGMLFLLLLIRPQGLQIRRTGV